MALWFKANKLAVNTSKTKYMIFRTKGKKITNNHGPLIFDENAVASGLSCGADVQSDRSDLSYSLPPPPS
jgi:hypothetical protein